MQSGFVNGLEKLSELLGFRRGDTGTWIGWASIDHGNKKQCQCKEHEANMSESGRHGSFSLTESRSFGSDGGGGKDCNFE